MLKTVIGFTASVFRCALVMPNLDPPIQSGAQARAYRHRILEAAGETANADFNPLMTVYFSDLGAEDLLRSYEDGDVFAVKYYPAGATTNSDSGGVNLLDSYPLLEALAAMQIPLLVHAESVDPTLDVFAREEAFLESQLQPVCEALPELRITVEHLSTRYGVDFVEGHATLAATITPHHLARDRSDLLSDGLRPDLYCKPVLNSADDRMALVGAATSGSHQFFLGTDSAPHPYTDKSAIGGLPGVFNVPNALAVVAEVFYAAGALDRLEAFTSVNGARRYGYPAASRLLSLKRRTEERSGSPIRELSTPNGSVVSVFGASEAGHWEIGPHSPSN